MNGFWFLDQNGNTRWDGAPADKQHQLGWNGVTSFAGDWNGDGRDSSGVFVNGFWFLDADGDGVWEGPGVDIQAHFGWSGVTPLVGDWNGDGRNKIGFFINGHWYFDYNGNGQWDGEAIDRHAHFGWAGVTPFVADWNGDGRDKPAIYTGRFWFYDINGNYVWDGPGVDRQFELGWAGATPLVGDWNGDGAEESGVFANGHWFLDYDGNRLWDGGVADKAYVFALAGAEPVVGDWNGDGATKVGLFLNGAWRLDANGNGAWNGQGADIAATFGETGYKPIVGHWATPVTGGNGGTRIIPSSGARDVPYNTRILVSLAERIDPSSVNAASVRVLSGDTPHEVARVVSADGRFLSLRGLFQPNSQYTVTVRGLRTPDGRTLTSAASTFSTGPNPNSDLWTAYRSFNYSVPPMGTLGFGLRSPIDPTHPSVFTLEERATGETMPIDCKPGWDLASLSCTLRKPPALGGDFVLRASSAFSIYGMPLAEHFFTTGLEPDRTRPTLIAIQPPDGSIDVNLSYPIRIRFDEPVAAEWPAPEIDLTVNGNPVQFTVSSNNPNELLLSIQDSGPAFDALVSITVRNVYDAAGLSHWNGPVTSRFTTAHDFSFPPFPFVDISPYGESAPRNAAVTLLSSTPLNPATVTTQTVRLLGPNGPVPATLHSDAATIVRVVPASLLAPQTSYNVVLGPNLFDAYGSEISTSGSFVTGGDLDTTAPAVVATLPPDGAQGVALNQIVGIAFSEAVKPTQKTSLRLERANGQIVAWALRSLSEAVIYHGGLLPNETYRVVAEGVTDLAGNPLPRYQSTFQTGAAARHDSTRPTLLSSNLARYATGVPLNQIVTLEFDEPISPLSLASITLSTSALETPVRAEVVGDGSTVTLTPLQPLLPDRQYLVNLLSVLDWAGNQAFATQVWFFTVETVSESTPPAILSITPQDGTIIDVGERRWITASVVFSEPIEYQTLSGQVFALLDGRQVSVSTIVDIDGRTAELSIDADQITADAELTLIIGPDVQDFYGNRLGAEHSFRFPLITESEDGTRPTFLSVRPEAWARSIPRDAILTIFTNVPVSTTRLQEKLLVAENGVRIPGVVSTRADDRIIEFRPLAPFEPGSTVRVFFREPFRTRTDDREVGTDYLYFGHTFTIAGGDLPPFEFVAAIDGDQPTSVRPRVRFSAPVDPASVTSSSVQLQGPSGLVPGTIHIVGEGDVVEFRPAQNLQPSAFYYSLTLTTQIRSTAGEALRHASSFHFSTTSGPDATPPGILAVSPTSAFSGAPLNARISIAFSEAVDRSLIRKRDFRLEALGRERAIEKILVGPRGAALYITPLEGLLPNTSYTLTFAGAVNTSGLSTGPLTTTFTTSDEVDAVPPKHLPEYSQAELPPNGRAVFRFDEPIDLVPFVHARVLRQAFNDVIPGSWSLAEEGLSAVFTPDRPLAVGSRFSVNDVSVTDLTGLLGSFAGEFQTGFGADTTPPSVTETSIPANAANVSPFIRVTLTLSEPLDPRTVSPSTARLLDGQTSLPVAVKLVRSGNPQVGPFASIEVGCKCALELAHSYTIELDGVTDFAGQRDPLALQADLHHAGRLRLRPANLHDERPRRQQSVPIRIRKGSRPRGARSGYDYNPERSLLGRRIALAISSPPGRLRDYDPRDSPSVASARFDHSYRNRSRGRPKRECESQACECVLPYGLR